MKASTNVGERILKALEFRGYSQADLARKLAENDVLQTEEVINSYKTNINRWIKGNVRPNMDKLEAIATALNVPLDYITGDFPFLCSMDEMDLQWFDKMKEIAPLEKYITDSLGYEIDCDDYWIPTETGQEALIYQIERETRAFLAARLENAGVRKKEVL